LGFGSFLCFIMPFHCKILKFHQEIDLKNLLEIAKSNGAYVLITNTVFVFTGIMGTLLMLKSLIIIN